MSTWHVGLSVPLKQIFIALSAAALPATAQTEAPELGAVTVIGTGLPTEVMRDPASITVITSEAIEQSAPVSVATLLRDVPGVAVSRTGAIGGLTQIRVRGT